MVFGSNAVGGWESCMLGGISVAIADAYAISCGSQLCIALTNFLRSWQYVFRTNNAAYLLLQVTLLPVVFSQPIATLSWRTSDRGFWRYCVPSFLCNRGQSFRTYFCHRAFRHFEKFFFCNLQAFSSSPLKSLRFVAKLSADSLYKMAPRSSCNVRTISHAYKI